jgi:hypothetical protein
VGCLEWGEEVHLQDIPAVERVVLQRVTVVLVVAKGDWYLQPQRNGSTRPMVVMWTPISSL